MRAPAFGLFACSLLLFFEFVSSTFREDMKKRYEKLVYNDVIRNSINRFIERRNKILRFSGMTGPVETFDLDRFDLNWSEDRGSFALDVHDHDIMINRGLKVTAFEIRESWSESAISLHLYLNIPTLTVQGGTWSFQGQWQGATLNVSDSYMFSYFNVTVRIRLEVKLQKFDSKHFWNLERVNLETYDLIPVKPDFATDQVSIFPDDIPMRSIIMEMRPAITSQLEKMIFDFFEKHFGECPWYLLMLGRF